MLLFLFLSSTGPVLNRHQRDSRAAEPGEALPCFQVLPVPLSGDGRGEARLGQGTAAGRDRTRTWKTSTAIVAEKRNSGSSCVLFGRFSRSTRSWSWPSLCPASLRSSWQPRRPWGVTAKLLLPSPPPAPPPPLLSQDSTCEHQRKPTVVLSCRSDLRKEDRCARLVSPATFNWWALCLLPWASRGPHFLIGTTWPYHGAVLTTRIVGQEPPAPSQTPDLLNKSHFHVASQSLRNWFFSFWASSWLSRVFYKLFRDPPSLQLKITAREWRSCSRGSFPSPN